MNRDTTGPRWRERCGDSTFPFRYPPLLKLAIQLLQSTTIRRMPTRVASDVEELPKQSVAVNLRPQIGVMVTSDTRESEKHRPLLSNGGFQTNEC